MFHEVIKAVHSGDINRVRKLLEEKEIRRGNKVTESNGYETPLSVAVKKGYVEIAELLIDNGADVNKTISTLRYTALMEACEEGTFNIEGRKKTVKLLMENGANTHIKRADGYDVFKVANGNGHAELARIIRHCSFEREREEREREEEIAKLIHAADLRDFDLSGIALANANMEKSNLGGKNLKGRNLNQANLNEAILKEVNLSFAKLVQANLKNADLRGANLKKANLSDANLDNANLSNANLLGAKLKGASINGTIFTNTILPDGGRKRFFTNMKKFL